MYDFIKDNENRIKTILGSSLTTQYWDKYMTSLQESSASGELIVFNDSDISYSNSMLNQCESENTDICTDWFISITGSLDS